MTAIEQLERDASIEEIDILAISAVIMHVIEVKGPAKIEGTIDSKEAIVDSLADMLEKILTADLNLSKQKKVEIIHLLNKLNANKEYIQMVKGNLTTLANIQVASERLSKKSQSAFELD